MDDNTFLLLEDSSRKTVIINNAAFVAAFNNRNEELVNSFLEMVSSVCKNKAQHGQTFATFEISSDVFKSRRVFYFALDYLQNQPSMSYRFFALPSNTINGYRSGAQPYSIFTTDIMQLKDCDSAFLKPYSISTERAAHLMFQNYRSHYVCMYIQFSDKKVHPDLPSDEE
jgi:hypothetical protein